MTAKRTEFIGDLSNDKRGLPQKPTGGSSEIGFDFLT